MMRKLIFIAILLLLRGGVLQAQNKQEINLKNPTGFYYSENKFQWDAYILIIEENDKSIIYGVYKDSVHIKLDSAIFKCKGAFRKDGLNSEIVLKDELKNIGYLSFKHKGNDPTFYTHNVLSFKDKTQFIKLANDTETGYRTLATKKFIEREMIAKEKERIAEELLAEEAEEKARIELEAKKEWQAEFTKVYEDSKRPQVTNSPAKGVYFGMWEGSSIANILVINEDGTGELTVRYKQSWRLAEQSELFAEVNKDSITITFENGLQQTMSNVQGTNVYKVNNTALVKLSDDIEKGMDEVYSYGAMELKRNGK